MSKPTRIPNGSGREWLDPEGRWHRIDGPAVELDGGEKGWYVRGNFQKGQLDEIDDGDPEAYFKHDVIAEMTGSPFRELPRGGGRR